MHQKKSCKICKVKNDRTKKKINKSTITVGGFNTGVPLIDNVTRQKIKKDIEESPKHHQSIGSIQHL